MTNEEHDTDKATRRAKIVSIALFSFMYDLENGVVFEEETLALAVRENILLYKGLIDEVKTLFYEWLETIE